MKTKGEKLVHLENAEGMAFGLPQSKLTYSDYLKISELTSLQHLLSQPPRHDEMLFIVIHQIYELWFKLFLHELDGTVEHLRRDEIGEGIRFLRRSVAIEQVLISQVSVLETMQPMDFLEFRDHLKPASGLQSVQFREIELVCGIKDSRVLNRYELGSADYKKLQRRLEAPSLKDEFYALLFRRGFKIEEHHRIEELKRIYESQSDYPDLVQLFESLLDLDEWFVRWRLIHLQMVERMIGSKTGTGGTEGVGYLKTTIDRKFFPELWEVRTKLGVS